MYTQKTSAIVLRTIGGRLQACWSNSLHVAGGLRPGGVTPTLGLLALVLLVLLIPLALVAFAVTHPALFANPEAGGLGLALAPVAIDVRALKDDIMAALTAMREANDEKIAQLEAKGTADPLLVAKVEKANAEITGLSAEMMTLQANLRTMENENARHNARGTEQETQQLRVHTRQFLALIRGVPARSIEITDGDIEQYRGYDAAFDAYLRLGDKAIKPDVRAALQVGSDPAGGYFVTPAHSSRIVELIYETSDLRPIASVETIGTDALEGDYDLDEASSGWVGEPAPRPETATPTVGGWRIPVFEQYAAPKLTQKQLDDSNRDIGGWLSGKVANKLVRDENSEFVIGNGINKPRGFLTYPAGSPTKAAFGKIAQVGTGVSGAFAASKPGDTLIDLVFGLKAAYRNGAQFAMSRNTVAATRKLADGQGNYLWQPDFTQRQNGALMGFGIAEMEDMPTLGANSLSIAFGNFKEAYQIVDHAVGTRVLRDPFTNKPWVIFYTTKRVGGDVVNFEALRLLKFG